MVRAILAGRKTITRRIVKHNVDAILNSPYHKEHSEVPDKALIEKLCRPPYQTGDILYVRETWGYGYDKEYIYKADDKLADLPLFKNSTKMIYRPSNPHAERSRQNLSAGYGCEGGAAERDYRRWNKE